jgi:hypothetical protein
MLFDHVYLDVLLWLIIKLCNLGLQSWQACLLQRLHKFDGEISHYALTALRALPLSSPFLQCIHL